MADPSFFVGILGNIISILVFTSPVATFRRVIRNKSTEEFRWLPYVTTLLCTSLRTFYGLLKPGGLLIITVNGAGAALQVVYVALYLAYAPRDTKVKMVKVVVGVNICFFAAVVVVGLVALHGAVRLFAVGVLCSALTIGMYAAPMAAMRTVVKTRSVEYMPLSLSFFLFLNGGIWSVYSLLVKDYFIGIPNGQRHGFRHGHGPTGALHGVPEQEEARGAQGGRRGERRAAPHGAGGAGPDQGAVVEEGAKPAHAVAAPRFWPPHQGIVRHPTRAAVCHEPAPARWGGGGGRRRSHSSKPY